MNPIWSAPEILNENPEGYDHTSDIYAYGITLWELFSRREPWAEKGFWGDVTDAVLEGGRPEVPEFWPLEYVTIMKECWAQNPADRPGWDKTLSALFAMYPLVERIEEQTSAERTKQLEARIEEENARKREEERIIEQKRKEEEARIAAEARYAAMAEEAAANPEVSRKFKYSIF